MKHANSYDVKMHIVFPSLICGVILSQNPGIFVGSYVVSKRESPMSLHYRLFAGTHIPYIVVRSRQEAGSSTSKEGIIVELKEMSKTLEETIKSSTKRKIMHV